MVGKTAQNFPNRVLSDMIVEFLASRLEVAGQTVIGLSYETEKRVGSGKSLLWTGCSL